MTLKTIFKVKKHFCFQFIVFTEESKQSFATVVVHTYEKVSEELIAKLFNEAKQELINSKKYTNFGLIGISRLK